MGQINQYPIAFPAYRAHLEDDLRRILKVAVNDYDAIPDNMVLLTTIWGK